MCFSAEADFVSGAVIGVVGVATLAKVEHRRELALGVVPLALALHQVVEGFVWLGLDDKLTNSSSDLAVHVYVAFAWVVLPVLLPLAILLVEPSVQRRRAMTWFGAANIVAVLAIAYVQADGLTSLWCAWAAVVSVLVYLQFCSWRRSGAPADTWDVHVLRSSNSRR